MILINQIFLSLILVLIIDSFIFIKAKDAKRSENLNISCLLCNLNRSIFNSSAKLNFKGHIAINHNIWNYFYFNRYIEKKPIKDRSSFEREIFMNHGIYWLPNSFAKGIKEPEWENLK